MDAVNTVLVVINGNGFFSGLDSKCHLEEPRYLERWLLGVENMESENQWVLLGNCGAWLCLWRSPAVWC